MPIDELAPAISLDATGETLTPDQIQNSKGLRHLPVVYDLTQGRVLALMAIELKTELTPEEYFTLLSNIKAALPDQEASGQMLACNAVPQFPGKRVNLYTTAHLRVEPIPEPTE